MLPSNHPTKATVYRAGDTWIRQYKSMRPHPRRWQDRSTLPAFRAGCDWTWGGGTTMCPAHSKLATGCHCLTQTSTSSSKHSATSSAPPLRPWTCQSHGKRRRVDKRMGGRIKMSRIFNDHPKPFVRKTRKATAPMLRVGFDPMATGMLTQRISAHGSTGSRLDPLLVPQRFSVELSSVVASRLSTSGTSRYHRCALWHQAQHATHLGMQHACHPPLSGCDCPEVDIGQKFGSAARSPSITAPNTGTCLSTLTPRRASGATTGRCVADQGQIIDQRVDDSLLFACRHRHLSGWRLVLKKVQIILNHLHSFVVALSLCFTILPYQTRRTLLANFVCLRRRKGVSQLAQQSAQPHRWSRTTVVNDSMLVRVQ